MLRSLDDLQTVVFCVNLHSIHCPDLETWLYQTSKIDHFREVVDKKNIIHDNTKTQLMLSVHICRPQFLRCET